MCDLLSLLICVKERVCVGFSFVYFLRYRFSLLTLLSVLWLRSLTLMLQQVERKEGRRVVYASLGGNVPQR